MKATELLVLTVENFIDHLDYCKDRCDKLGAVEVKLDDWYLKLNKAVDEVYREQQGLPPRPITGRPRGSRDKAPRRKPPKN